MRKVVSKGKNIREAISIGLELLDATKQEVDIEILQQETKGFMGIRGKQAVVQLTRVESIEAKEETDVFNELEKMIEEDQTELPKLDTYKIKQPQVESLAGKVWVENGRLQCKSSPSHFPMVTIGEGIQFYKNNQLVKEKTVIVSELDVYDLKVKHEERETRWSVKMDLNKLKVEVKVDPGYTITRFVPDTEAGHNIELRVEEKKEVVNTLRYSDLMKKLENLRVIHGFYQDEIVKATQTESEGIFLIAEGIKAQPGKDGWVELKVNIDDINEGPKETSGGRVDFRETKTLPNVERGQVVAVIHPPEPGKMGYTVTNEPLPAKQTHPVIVRTGNGVSVVDDKIVATESGRPQVEERGKLVKVAILPKLVHEGNVNLATGNIRFKGDVEIVGEVDERMVVEAEGDVTVHKTVTSATITSSGAIVTYGNIISSEISAGKSNLLIVELGHLIGTLHRDAERIISVIRQLTLSPAFKSSDFSRGGLQPLIRILLEKKFKDFQTQAKRYVEVVRKGEDYLLEDDWRQVSVSLTHLFLSITNEVTSLERIKDLSMKMKELHEQSETPVEPDSYITVPNALNSKMYCSGNILVLGQGAVNTKIHSGGKLKISGIIRGGEVYGRLGVEINEVGAESGTPTLISVPADQTISIQKAMEGTIIRLGSTKYTFNQTTYGVRGRLDSEGKLTLH
ncbi:flagellar assembly protein A [Rossellomorea oryzaecorticis]|uniref:Flagellar assembly protein A n=1 Tax=Rossellomorea oryzaecorticis TaxID=1396505 RepID=A0ABW8VLJ1_9BACI